VEVKSLAPDLKTGITLASCNSTGKTWFWTQWL